jgi:2-oxoglutarate dehydrogenase E1 component
MKKSLKDRYASSPLFSGNAPLVEGLYEQFLLDPDSVDGEIRSYFEKIAAGVAQTPRRPLEAALKKAARRPPAMTTTVPSELLRKEMGVLQLIEAYRLRGHLLANLDPLGLVKPERPPELDPASYSLCQSDHQTEFAVPHLGDQVTMTLGEIQEKLNTIYCGTIGAELAHITSAEERHWLQDRFEAAVAGRGMTAEERKNILVQLTAAEGIERYLHTRYVGQKRFSLEGGESLIPLLYDLIQHGGNSGLQEIVIGMAHRGRINVLVNVLGKSPSELFSEFEGSFDIEERTGSGDVKYHMGFSSDMPTPGGEVHLALAFNPSHLEIVNPVVEGSVRARQERRGDSDGKQVMPVLIHGDAAFAGQGVVMETLQMSQVRGFRTGGTVHIIINNQIGFTTSDPDDTRSTHYCSDVAKMIEAPIFHVNGDDPGAVVLVSRLAVDYREKFGKDVVVDLVCYRRHGHNEADEPAATQPMMYQDIRRLPTVRRIYAERLIGLGVVTEEQSNDLVTAYRDGLDQGKVISRPEPGTGGNEFTVDWTPYLEASDGTPVATSISVNRVQDLAGAISNTPDDLKMHPRVARIMSDRVRMASGEIPMDWGFAETISYASLLTENYAVRLTGQDSGRGTFFHRHAVLHDQAGKAPWLPLRHLADNQGPFEVIDSLLSEEAVLGFEYGFATTEPETLVIWEGQFGDFVNGAQVVIDQFISSGEAKWGRHCGLTMFLPHGYEGQGPEHSSGRLERFLQLCEENNIQVCVPSTPAQIFHLVRRQMISGYRKPLVVMTPKSLLRHRMAVSPLSDLSEGQFHQLIPETEALDPAGVRRIVFCSGKVYYDLFEARQAKKQTDVALIRLEQLYPFPQALYNAVIQKYSAAADIVWCQEEPKNQGAWYQTRHHLQEPLGPDHTLHYAGRAGAAAPASGYHQLHVRQQQELVSEALATTGQSQSPNQSEATAKIRENA